jgi:Fe-S-cluster containining protein
MFNIVKNNVNLTCLVNDEPEVEVPCGSCTLCCSLLAPSLTPDEVSSGKYPISLTAATKEIFVIDPTVGPVVTMFKNKQGGCAMLIDGKCSIYEDRPKACRQFDCRKGHHPKTNGALDNLQQK